MRNTWKDPLPSARHLWVVHVWDEEHNNRVLLWGRKQRHHHPLFLCRNTSSLLHSKSWKIENWRSLVWETILVSSTTAKELVDTRSQLDQREWSIGSTVEQQPVGKLLQQSFGEAPRGKLSKPTQSKPNPIYDRSEKPEDTERVFMDKGKTSRSQEIDDKRLHKELGSSDRTGKLVKLSEDIRVMHAHDGTGELVKSSSSSAHTVKEQFVPAEHRDIASFDADNEFNRATDEENIDFNIPGVPNSMVKRSHGVNVQNLIQKIENHPQRQALQSDLQLHRAFNLFSQESQDVIEAAGNTELCEILDVEPKAQCRACLAYWGAGIVYRTCGHFLRDDTTENKSTSSPFLISSLSRTFTSGRADHTVTGTGRKKVLDNTILQLNSKRSAGNEDTRTFTIDLFVTHGFRKTMLELDRTEVICEMDKLANEDHTHIATEEELNVYRGSWWIRSNFVGSDTMPIRHRPDFKQALSTLHRLKKADDEAYFQNWWHSSSSSWWQWQDSWWQPSFETSPRRCTWHWWNRETWEVSETSIYVWHESHKEFGAKLQCSFR